jgi:glycosyltransferase involved in cell wall biosynthesis
MEYVPDIERYCASVQTVAPSWTWKQKLRQAWRGLWTHPLMIGRRARAEMRAHIRRVVAEFDIDVIQFEWTETGVYADAVAPGEVVTILDEVDVSYRPREYQAKYRGSRSLRPYLQWRSHRAKKKELALCRRFEAVLTRSEYDRQILLPHLPNSQLEVFLPWTYVADFAGIGEEERHQGRLLFVGAMDRDQNCEAVLYFYHDVLPRIKLGCPYVEFWIVGANPQPRVRHLDRDPAVQVTGYVEDLRAVYAACDVFVAPMRAPGGVFNKIVDAMAAGRPVVTTSLGNEGVSAPTNTSVCVVDEPGDFADRTLALLQNDVLWQQVASGGRRHVQRAYDWEANISRLELLYERLV